MNLFDLKKVRDCFLKWYILLREKCRELGQVEGKEKKTLITLHQFTHLCFYNHIILISFKLKTTINSHALECYLVRLGHILSKLSMLILTSVPVTTSFENIYLHVSVSVLLNIKCDFERTYILMYLRVGHGKRRMSYN